MPTGRWPPARGCLHALQSESGVRRGRRHGSRREASWDREDRLRQARRRALRAGAPAVPDERPDPEATPKRGANDGAALHAVGEINEDRARCIDDGHQTAPLDRIRQESIVRNIVGWHPDRSKTHAKRALGLSGDLTQAWTRASPFREKGLGLPRPNQPFSTHQNYAARVGRSIERLPTTLCLPRDITAAAFRSLNRPTQVTRIGQGSRGRRNPACERTAPQKAVRRSARAAFWL